MVNYKFLYVDRLTDFFAFHQGDKMMLKDDILQCLEDNPTGKRRRDLMTMLNCLRHEADKALSALRREHKIVRARGGHYLHKRYAVRRR